MRTTTVRTATCTFLLAAAAWLPGGAGAQEAEDRNPWSVGLRVAGFPQGFEVARAVGPQVDLGLGLHYAVADQATEREGVPGTIEDRTETLRVGPFVRLYLDPEAELAPTAELHLGYLRTDTDVSGPQPFTDVSDGFTATGSVGLTWLPSSLFQVTGGVAFRRESVERSGDGAPAEERDRWDLFVPTLAVAFRF